MEKIEQFEALIKKVQEDEALQKQCAEAIKAGKAEELLKEMGYTFSLKELVTYLEERNEELSPEDLDAIAGGRTSGRRVASATVTWIGVFVTADACKIFA